MDYSECLEEDGEFVLELDLQEFTEQSISGRKIEFLDYFCDKLIERQSSRSILEENKIDKVVFILRNLNHITLIRNFIEDLQQKTFSKTFPEEITKSAIRDSPKSQNGYLFSWPSNWFIRICFIHNLEMKKEHLCGICALPNVEVLCIRSNHLDILPNYISQLKNLKVLNFANNNLENLPSTLCLCRELVEIRVEYNRLTSLPACLRKMKNLRKIARLGSYRHGGGIEIDVNERRGYPVIYLCDKNGDKIEINNDENANNKNNKKVFSPDSLFHLAAYKALKQDFAVFTKLGSMVLPKHVVNDLTCTLPSLKFCDQCNCGFAKDEYYVIKKLFADFNGYKNIVFEAKACSSFCCDKIFDEWTFIAENEIKEYANEQFCFDVVDDDDDDDHHQNPSNSGTANQNWFRKYLFCL